MTDAIQTFTEGDKVIHQTGHIGIVLKSFHSTKDSVLVQFDNKEIMPVRINYLTKAEPGKIVEVENIPPKENALIMGSGRGGGKLNRVRWILSKHKGPILYPWHK